MMTKWFFILVNIALSLSAQITTINPDSITSKIYNSDLKIIYSTNKVVFNKPTVIVSGLNCLACVNYFIQAKKKYHFLFLLNSESLSEINRLLAQYHVDKKQTFFTTNRSLLKDKEAIIINPTPMMVCQKGEKFILYHYNVLDSLSEGFTVRKSNFLEKLTK